ncbi:SOS response-associated peptidase family protein (plasmid) [Pseudomonas nitroreducens]|uniref:SOS response-associated peptidase family protein n=1 Tax=Pseudomonas nitroreducens TaxID=46680 RepID=UPI003D02DF34
MISAVTEATRKLKADPSQKRKQFMCERVAQINTVSDLMNTLQWGGQLNQRTPLHARPLVCPQECIALLHREHNQLVLDTVRWGWRPRWAKIDRLQTNARVDKVTYSSYWKPVWQHRAVCPVSGWFEYLDDSAGTRQLFYIRRRDGQPSLIAAAGQFPREGRNVQAEDGLVLLVAERRGSLLDERALRPIVLAPAVALDWLSHETDKQRAEAIAQGGGEADGTFEWFAVGKQLEDGLSIDQLRAL